MQVMQTRYRGAPVQQPVGVPDPISTFMPRLQPRRYWIFWSALLGGIAGLIGLTDATVSTHSVRLEDIFIVAGSLFVPTLYVLYLDLRNLFVDPRWRTIIATFVLGAVVGAPLAVILEIIFHAGTGAPIPALTTGLIEELCKALAVLWLMRRRYRFLSFEMDGIILGAAAGMGFAALEDIGYAAAAFTQGLHVVVATVWTRAVLGPFGHGTWTAIVVGTIWREKGAGAPRITRRVVGAYLVAAALHGAWDWMPFEGVLGLVWLLGVGSVGLLIVRAMVHEALGQEEAFLQQAGPASRSGPSPAAPR